MRAAGERLYSRPHIKGSENERRRPCQVAEVEDRVGGVSQGMNRARDGMAVMSCLLAVRIWEKRGERRTTASGGGAIERGARGMSRSGALGHGAGVVIWLA